MNNWPDDLLQGALEAAPESLVLCEARGPDHVLVYANAAFERLTGYPREELLGRDLRCLQSWDRDQEARAQLAAALGRGEPCRVLLRNYRKDGTQYWNELAVQPLRDAAGELRYFAGYHRDVTEREAAAQRQAPAAPERSRVDRLSGLISRAHFEQRLRQEWQAGLQARCILSLAAFDIDELEVYNDTFGRAAGDACIRRVAAVIGACLRRGSDLVTRWDGGCLLAMMRNSDPAAVPGFVASVSRKILELRIHHPRARHLKFVSVSAGTASLAPRAELSPQLLVDEALRALGCCKRERDGTPRLPAAPVVAAGAG